MYWEHVQVKRWITGAAALVILTAGIASADPDSQQKNKNLWRNVTVGSGAVALHGLLSHNSTETLLGAAGAAYSGSRYETDRHHQSQKQQAAKNSASATAAALNRKYRTSNRWYYASNGHVYKYLKNTDERLIVA